MQVTNERRPQLPPYAKWLFGAALTTGAYMFLVRPWHLRWGARNDEVARAMPLDERVRKPLYVTNRAVTIHAKPEAIWPWLVQMGESPRGGFYSYEWIERLMGMKVENADHVLPEFQRVQEGEALDRSGGMSVLGVSENEFLVLGPPDSMADTFLSTWCIALYPEGETTRLVSRVRAWIKPSLARVFWMAVLDPGQFIMERKWLLEVKKRAEAGPEAAKQLT